MTRSTFARTRSPVSWILFIGSPRRPGSRGGRPGRDAVVRAMVPPSRSPAPPPRVEHGPWSAYGYASPMDHAAPRLVRLGRAVCGHRAAAVRREWLVTNGLGGYAFGTVAGPA